MRGLGLMVTGMIVVLALRGGAQGTAAAGWELVVLGVAQDAGSPQLGCQQDLCVQRRAGARPIERVSSLGLVHRGTGRAYLFDATPDLPSQVQSLTGGPVPDGIFLTHAHIGHYTGLMYLGRESMNAKAVTVHVMPRMKTVQIKNCSGDFFPYWKERLY